MTRKEQFEALESMFTWEEESIGNYKAAFYANYRLLNDLMDLCVTNSNFDEMPRVAYLKYTQNFYLLCSQLCITMECLIKDLMINNDIHNNETLHKHKFVELLSSLREKECIGETNEILQELKDVEDVLRYMDDINMFVNARYHDLKDDKISLQHINIIKPVFEVVDKIYIEHYSNVNWIDITYGSMI